MVPPPPVRTPNGVSTPVRTPNDVYTPVKTSNGVSTPLRTPNDVSTPARTTCGRLFIIKLSLHPANLLLDDFSTI